MDPPPLFPGWEACDAAGQHVLPCKSLVKLLWEGQRGDGRPAGGGGGGGAGGGGGGHRAHTHASARDSSTLPAPACSPTPLTHTPFLARPPADGV